MRRVSPRSSERPRRRPVVESSRRLRVVRYWVPFILIVAGQVILIGGEGSAYLEGWAMFTGAGLSVLLLNTLHRAGVDGDVEREREDAARAYFERHKRWPDEG